MSWSPCSVHQGVCVVVEEQRWGRGACALYLHPLLSCTASAVSYVAAVCDSFRPWNSAAQERIYFSSKQKHRPKIICMCVCVCLCTHTCSCAGTCVWRLEVNADCPSQSLPILCVERRPLLTETSWIQLAMWASKAGPLVHIFPEAVL